MTGKRLATAQTIADLRAMAGRRVPRAVFDYVDGGAEEEQSLRRARDVFRSLEFHPRVLCDVSGVDTRTVILGAASAQPFALAPTGFNRLLHADGERAVARVAQRSCLAYTLATMSTTSIEEAAAAAPSGRRWFQLYIGRDRGITRELIERAQAAGYEALMLTVDSPVGGQRRRDLRNGLGIPPRLTARSLLELATRPRWWFGYARARPLTLASLSQHEGTVLDHIRAIHDPSVTLTDVAGVRGLWKGKLVVKGVQDPADARQAVSAGADVVVLSNHGGRQLDRAPAPLTLLAGTLAVLHGAAEVWLDGGVMSGADIVAAVALGANLCLVGRAYLYGLMAGGEAGVQRAVDILAEEVLRTMQLLGVTRIAELDPARVTLSDGRRTG